MLKVAPLVKRSIALTTSVVMVAASAGSRVQAQEPSEIKFQLYPIEQFVPCMAANPYVTPTVDVTVKRGNRNDLMKLTLKGFKPGIQFDLFSLEKSLQLADGTIDPNFRGFGLVWYQSDLRPGTTIVKTILLDQIFGFDSAVNLKPTKTFHLGFWFNNPEDAKECGFDPSKPTPFNGEQKAGPLAFITRPVLPAGLGPLCTKPNTSTTPATCDP
ncbi:MAG: hypothetical protein HC780_07150 [Leptolyngbyaceae cyanobacterium CSU_1_3]|nr:hypothetical protein [Leptolyngbyaceae cyanobacterium CSU_1_3]